MNRAHIILQNPVNYSHCRVTQCFDPSAEQGTCLPTAATQSQCSCQLTSKFEQKCINLASYAHLRKCSNRLHLLYVPFQCIGPPLVIWVILHFLAIQLSPGTPGYNQHILLDTILYTILYSLMSL